MIGLIGIVLIIFGWSIAVGTGVRCSDNPTHLWPGIAISIPSQASGIYLLFQWLNA